MQKEASAYIDSWHIMSYDYTVSDLSGEGAAVMSPNAPLYNPKPPALQKSINQTVWNYLAAGVDKSKLTIGLPFYSHTWFAPDLLTSSDPSAWKAFGNKGVVQGSCCGPFKSTFGAQPGQGCAMCGLYMYSEIVAALGSNSAVWSVFDNQTASSIAFVQAPGGSDGGYTKAGTWISYNEPKSIKAMTDFAVKMGIRGVFAFDSSQDTKDYLLMNLIADTIGGHGSATPPSPAPTPGPAPPPSPPSPPPPTPPGSGQCAGKPDGMYCVQGNNHSFVYCPQNAVESCAAQTCCKVAGKGTIMCDWCK